jgi:hypothetical protein
VAASVEDLDADFQWAASIASFAEILKGSPFAGVSMFPAIRSAVNSAAHDDHPDRVAFRPLFSTAELAMTAQ